MADLTKRLAALGIGQKNDTPAQRLEALIDEWRACEKELREAVEALDTYGVGAWGGSVAGGVHELAGRMLRLAWKERTDG